VIVDQLVNGQPIAPGSKISSGTLIQFKVGDGGSVVGFEVPDLIGLTVGMAKANLAVLGLQIGNISSSTAIQDTSNAFIIMQNPRLYSDQLDSLGMPIKNITTQGGSIDIVIDKVAPVIKHDSIK